MADDPVATTVVKKACYVTSPVVCCRLTEPNGCLPYSRLRSVAPAISTSFAIELLIFVSVTQT
jgi:hypothetical protein